jgi:RNA polymerase sigma factor (sigma-70 family)
MLPCPHGWAGVLEGGRRLSSLGRGQSALCSRRWLCRRPGRSAASALFRADLHVTEAATAVPTGQSTPVPERGAPQRVRRQTVTATAAPPADPPPTTVPEYRIGLLHGVGAEVERLSVSRTKRVVEVAGARARTSTATRSPAAAAAAKATRKPAPDEAAGRVLTAARARVRVFPQRAAGASQAGAEAADLGTPTDHARLSAPEEAKLTRLVYRAQQLELVRTRLVDERIAERVRASEAVGAIAAAAALAQRGAGRDEPTDGEWARAAGLSTAAALRDALAAGGRARDVLVAKNMGLVYKAANAWRRSARTPMWDLIQEGAAGLVRATELFDPGRGLRFSTYATPWVNATMRRAIQNTGRVVRLPVRLYESQAKLLAARTVLRTSGVYEPSAAQLAAQSGLTLEQVASTEVWFKSEKSLDDVLTYGGGKQDDRQTTLESNVEGDAAKTQTAADVQTEQEQEVAADLMRQALLNVLDTL